MQAFIVVRNKQLPVCADIISNSLMQPQLGHAPGSKAPGQISQLDGERLGMLASIDENVTIPKVGVQLVKRVVETLEGRRIHMRRAQQPAVQSVGPAVVGTLNPSCEAALGSRTE